MTSRDMAYLVLGFLGGGLFGSVLQQSLIQHLLFRDVDQLPWRVKTRLGRYFGWLSWSKSCARVEEADRAHYATILIGTLHDLGGPLLLAPESKKAFDGMIAEAERRYAEDRRKRKRK